jgi:hypothetical protein
MVAYQVAADGFIRFEGFKHGRQGAVISPIDEMIFAKALLISRKM